MDVEGELTFPKWFAKQGMNVLSQAKIAVGIHNDFRLRHVTFPSCGSSRKRFQIRPGIYRTHIQNRGDSPRCGAFLADILAKRPIDIRAEILFRNAHETVRGGSGSIKQRFAQGLEPFAEGGSVGMHHVPVDFLKLRSTCFRQILQFQIDGIRRDRVFLRPAVQNREPSAIGALLLVFENRLFRERLREKQHSSERVRRARLGAGGKAIVYERGFDLFLYDIAEGKSRKLEIDATADDKTNPDKITVATQGASEYALSADEKNIAIVIQGEIFLMPRNGGKAKRVTDHPAYDHGVAWAPDNKRLLFLSDRTGDEDIYALVSDDPDHAELMQAHRFKVTQITKTAEPEVGVSFAPDGKRVAFLRAGKLITMNADGTDEKTVIGDGHVFDYEWSPDGQWFAVAKNDAFFASEIFIVPSVGATQENPIRNVTRFATFNGDVTWSRTGNRLAFVSRRRGDTQSAFVLSLQKPLASGAATNKDIDWDGIHLRVKQPTPMNA